MKLVLIFLLLAMLVVSEMEAKQAGITGIFKRIVKAACKYISEHLRKRELGSIDQTNDIKQLTDLVGERGARDVMAAVMELDDDPMALAKLERDLREIEESY